MTDPLANAVPPAPSACCDLVEEATRAPCALCTRPTCGACRAYVNGRGVCGTCAHTIRDELAAETAGAGHLPGGVLGGAVGALLGGVAWALVAIGTGLAIGYVAIGVGFLAGFGTFLGAGRHKGRRLQVVAVVCALVGLALGKYLIVAHLAVEKFPDAGFSYLDGRLVRVFAENISDFVRPFDILWVILALGAASRATRPTAVGVRMPRAAR